MAGAAGVHHYGPSLKQISLKQGAGLRKAMEYENSNKIIAIIKIIIFYIHIIFIIDNNDNNGSRYTWKQD